MHQISQVEQSLLFLGSADKKIKASSGYDGVIDMDNETNTGIAVKFLIEQHKIEILDNKAMAFSDMIGETFNKEFMNMLQVCIFVPLLHKETPKPKNIPKTAPVIENAIPHYGLIRDILNFRMRIGQE